MRNRFWNRAGLALTLASALAACNSGGDGNTTGDAMADTSSAGGDASDSSSSGGDYREGPACLDTDWDDLEPLFHPSAPETCDTTTLACDGNSGANGHDTQLPFNVTAGSTYLIVFSADATDDPNALFSYTISMAP